MNNQWTFETDLGGGIYLKSSKRFATPTEAAQAMVDWLVICADNGIFPLIRLQAITENGDH